MSPEEVWKPVPGYEGSEVSNRGRVRTLVRKYFALGGPKWKYRWVGLRQGDKIRTEGVHRLVLRAFVGPPPPGCVACHNDGQPGNNRVENLRWDTYQANAFDKRRHGTHQAGATHPRTRVSAPDARRIKALLARGVAAQDLAACFEVSELMIGLIAVGAHWTAREGRDRNGATGCGCMQPVRGRTDAARPDEVGMESTRPAASALAEPQTAAAQPVAPNAK